ncbi:c-type cytochrome [Citreimonas salinaria]|uniref:Cytochrome c n=1 Tax=Citreimonas salinaria TaxID=321339 RepID=A0A1H3J4Q2_9RHOB|nr:c-type cytochrome [Citreimonas salinaria]SDY34882.1 Cytochrome c [Citreimonas salinaria]
MTPLSKITAVVVLTVGSFAAVSAGAQDYSETPGIDALVANLDSERALFNARVEAPVDDDLLEAGRLVAMGGAEFGGSGMACFTCHGANGRGDGSAAFPRLAGLPGWYMYKQLMDYASGTRPNQIMTGIAQKLTEREMEAVATYYAAIDAPFRDVTSDIAPDVLQWGGMLGAVGSAEKGIPACVNCHGPSGTGNPPSVPYLAGQYATYMEHQLMLWREGTRDNDPMNVMSAIADKMSDEDMRAVSEYYARVRAQEDIEDAADLGPTGLAPEIEPLAETLDVEAD